MPNNSSSSGSRSNEEPNTAPEPDRWYNLTLGPSFKEQLENSSRPRTPKFCTLRYESKPASIDKSQAGFLHKTDKKVTVEYHNNQPGKPKVIFEGGCAEYKENDAVLFFDGEIFRLEQLHRAVKRLRRVWPSGDSAAAATAATFVSPAVDAHTTPVSKEANMQSPSKGIACQIPENVVHVEQIGIGKSKNIVSDMARERSAENPPVSPHPTDTSTDPKNDKCEEQIDIFDDDELGTSNTGNVSEKGLRTGLDIDINLPHQAETDDEIADVDISDDEGDKGPNAAEALRAQVIAERGSERTSSSSSTSESESDSSGSESGTGSGSSSTESESSDGDSAISP